MSNQSKKAAVSIQPIGEDIVSFVQSGLMAAWIHWIGQPMGEDIGSLSNQRKRRQLVYSQYVQSELMA